MDEKLKEALQNPQIQEALQQLKAEKNKQRQEKPDETNPLLEAERLERRRRHPRRKEGLRAYFEKNGW